MSLDQTKLDEFLQTFVADVAAAKSAVCTYIGDTLGLYQAMADDGPLTSSELAEATDTHERYVREWLANQAAGGYVTYEPGAGTFALPAEQAAVLADPDSPLYLCGIFEIAGAMWAAADQVADAFRTGDGVDWGAHDPKLYRGVERLFAPVYRTQLIDDWIPALDGVDERLRTGGRVADVGCGHGASTVAMAQAYPQSRFVGFDSHAPSVAAAAKAAAEAGVGERVAFEAADADAIHGSGYDLVCLFNCWHDMGDPLAAAAHIRQTIADDGTLLLVEYMAGDDLTDNLHPIGRMLYAVSTVLCTPTSLAQEGATGLGAQPGETRLTEMLTEAGFTRVRRAAETPFNLILEARP